MATRRKRKQVTWGARLTQGLQAFFGTAGDDVGTQGAGARGGVAHIFDRSSEMMDVAEEVAAEQRGRVLILDRNGSHARWLLAQLRQQPPIPSFADVAREGFFTLVRLESGEPAYDAGDDSAEEAPAEAYALMAAPAQNDRGNGYHGFDGCSAGARHDAPEATAGWTWGAAYSEPADPFARIEEEGIDADLILFLFTGSEGWSEAEARLYGRLRSLSMPILPVALFGAADRDTEECQAFLRRLRQWTGMEPSVLAMADWDATGAAQAALDAGLRGLVDRMLALRPRLAVPLAQEVPFYRRAIAMRIIRTGALMTGLLGAEPIPLLDLPLQVAVQWKVAMQLATIYGRPGLDVRSREMVGTVGLNLIVRYVAQQLAKIVPGVGFLLSALLSGLSTVLLGRALLRIYEHDRLVDWAATKAALNAQGEHIAAPLRTSVASGMAAAQQTTQRVAGAGAALGQSVRQKVRRAPPAAPAVMPATDPASAPAAEAQHQSDAEGAAPKPGAVQSEAVNTEVDAYPLPGVQDAAGAAAGKEHEDADPLAAVAASKGS